VDDKSLELSDAGFYQGFLNSSHINVNENVADLLRLKNAYKLNSETIQKLYSTDDMIVEGR
jgi:flagellar basal body rod protein FlgG